MVTKEGQKSTQTTSLNLNTARQQYVGAYECD